MPLGLGWAWTFDSGLSTLKMDIYKHKIENDKDKKEHGRSQVLIEVLLLYLHFCQFLVAQN